MASKVYTAHEMRVRANLENNVWGDKTTAEMLRQSADMMELIAQLKAEIEGMETAPLDGVFAHMNINAKVALAKLDFYKKVSALKGLPKCDEKREKNYEYAVEFEDLYHGGWSVYKDGLTLDEAQKLSHYSWSRIVRREVGDWEVFKNER